MEAAGFVVATGNERTCLSPRRAGEIDPHREGEIRVLHIARERSLGSQASSGSAMSSRRRTINFRGGPPGDNEDLETAERDSRDGQEEGEGAEKRTLCALNPDLKSPLIPAVSVEEDVESCRERKRPRGASVTIVNVKA